MRGLLPWFTFSFFSDRKPGASLGEVRSTHVSTFPGAAGQALGGGTGPMRAVSSPAVAVLAEVGGPTVQGDARQDAVTSHGGGRCPRTGLCHRDLSLQWLCLSGERESDIRS